MELETWISGMDMPVEVASISRTAVRNWQAAGCPDNIDGFLDAHGYTGREVRAIAKFALDACPVSIVKLESHPA